MPKKGRTLTQLEGKDLKKFRIKVHKKQKCKCPILNKKFPVEDMVVDHQHMTKAETIGINGAGLVRGVIHRQANVLEGKITNAYKRYGLEKMMPLPKFLRNLAKYLEQENLPIIHPSEKPKAPKLKKSSYNAIVRLARSNGCRKIPPYPKSKKLTVALKALYETYGVEPEYYK